MFDIEIADALTAKPDAYVLRDNISTKVLPATGSAEPDDETRTCEICVAINKVVYPRWNKLVFNHPYCKCNEKTYRGNLIAEHPIKKVTEYLLVNKDKSAAMRSMGYKDEDALEIHEKISKIRKEMFMVEFMRGMKTIAIMPVYVGDIETYRDSEISDDVILKDLPSNDPSWWCKVEDGYIFNLKGERKNKIPYDYRS